VGDVWKVIRADYARRWAAVKPIGGRARAHGATQAAVAAHGGLAGQNAVSRIVHGKGAGPQVETFVRGLMGLGVKPSDFFAAIEHQFLPAVEPPWARAASARPTEAPRSPAADALDAERARLLKAGRHAQQIHDLFATVDAHAMKRR
jgi:hypothetical protein